MSLEPDGITIRKATPADGDAIERLFVESPDEGAVSFAPRFSHDAYEAYNGLRTDSAGFVAETGDGRIVGVGFVSLTEARFGGHVRPSALLNAVAVHPDARGQGLARRIARHRIEYARDHLGDDCVAFANIQHGNAPSRAVAESWADELTYDFVMYPAPPLDEKPADSDYAVHEASDAELETALESSNDFYGDAELYRPRSPAAFRRLRAESPIDDPLHRYLVATADGEVVAGVAALDMHRVMKLVVESLPPELADADELPPAIPESKELRTTMLSDLWHAPGREAAARALWTHLRATTGNANRVMLDYDPGGPVADALAIDPEGGIELSVAVSGPTLQDADVAPVF
jgi:GNAT superfamily N-acetyltransferase